jgi:hypothetical protein
MAFINASGERWDGWRNVGWVPGAPFLARSLRENWGFPSPEFILSVIPKRAESQVRNLLFTDEWRIQTALWLEWDISIARSMLPRRVAKALISRYQEY